MPSRMLAAIALLAAPAAVAALTPEPTPQATPEAGKAEDKLICKKISDNPSDRLAPRRKVCLTAAQWKEARRQQKGEMPEQRGSPSRY